MAGTPETIVLDPAKPQLERAEATQIRAKMLQETLGSAGKNIMDIVTQYQDIKQQKQKNDLAAMTMAGTLSGGMDKLPQDAKNKLPGMLGVPLPTDEQGNVQITPDTETVIKRKTAELIQSDPENLKIIAGLQEKRTDPFKLASDEKMKEMQLAGDREKDANAAARSQAENASRVNAALIGQKGRIEAAKITAAGKTDKNAAPSPFVLDPDSGTVMSEPQWYSTHPGKVMPAKLSVGDAKMLVDKQKADAAVKAHQASVDASQARIRTLDFHLKTMMSDPDPNNLTAKKLKNLNVMVKTAMGSGVGESVAKDMVNEQLPEIMRDMGYKDEDIAGIIAAAGDGGLWSHFTNWVHTFGGTTATETGPSLRQDQVGDTTHIPGISPPPAFGGQTGTTGGGATQSTPGTGGKTMSADEFQKQYPRQ